MEGWLPVLSHFIILSTLKRGRVGTPLNFTHRCAAQAIFGPPYINLPVTCDHVFMTRGWVVACGHCGVRFHAANVKLKGFKVI